VLHSTTKGDFRQQAVLSMPYYREAGAHREIFNKIDYMNLPNENDNE
jgi:hypothetical protein